MKTDCASGFKFLYVPAINFLLESYSATNLHLLIAIDFDFSTDMKSDVDQPSELYILPLSSIVPTVVLDLSNLFLLPISKLTFPVDALFKR